MEWWRANLTTMSWVCAMLHEGKSESACRFPHSAYARAPQLTLFLLLTLYKLLWLSAPRLRPPRRMIVPGCGAARSRLRPAHRLAVSGALADG